MLKKSVVINAKRIKPIENISPDYKTVIFFTLFVCGIILGVIIIQKSNEDFSSFFLKLLNNHLTAKKSSSWFNNFCGDFLGIFLLVFLTYILGLCAVGLPFIWLIPICFGCITGIILSLFFINYGLTGLAFCGLINIPCNAITAATLIKCCCESTRISNEIFLFVLGGNNDKAKSSLIKEYSLKYALLCLPILVAAIISSSSFTLFSGLFSFVNWIIRNNSYIRSFRRFYST